MNLKIVMVIVFMRNNKITKAKMLVSEYPQNIMFYFVKVTLELLLYTHIHIYICIMYLSTYNHVELAPSGYTDQVNTDLLQSGSISQDLKAQLIFVYILYNLKMILKLIWH